MPNTAFEPSGSSFTTSGVTYFNDQQVTWTAVATAVLSPATQSWEAVYGTFVDQLNGGIPGGRADFKEGVLLGAGGGYGATGISIDGDPNGVSPANATATDTLTISFSSPVPAGTRFILWGPGAYYYGVSGPYTYTISSSNAGRSVSDGFSLYLSAPFNNSFSETISYSSSTATITDNTDPTFGTYYPDAAIILVSNTPIDQISVTAKTIPYDTWGIEFLDVAKEPSVAEFLEFSKLAYDETTSPSALVATTIHGFSVVTSESQQSAAGLNAILLKNESSHQIVFSFRGSLLVPFNAYDFGTSDVDIGKGQTPPVFSAAEKWVESELRKFGGYSFFVTGHSLGAAEAQYVSAMNNLPGVTFAGPGVSSLLPSGASQPSGLVNFVDAYDAIGNYTLLSGSHVGATVTLNNPLYYSTAAIGGILGKAALAITFHDLGVYGQELVSNNISSSNPLGNSKIVAAPLALLFDGLQSDVVRTDNLGNTIETATLALLGFETTSESSASPGRMGTQAAALSNGVTLTETIGPTGNVTYVFAIASGVNSAQQTISYDQATGLSANTISVNGTAISTSASTIPTLNVASNGTISIGYGSQQAGTEATLSLAPNGSSSVTLGGDSSSSSVDLTTGFLQGLNQRLLRSTDSISDANSVLTRIALGQLTLTDYVNQLVVGARPTSSVATMSYQFFTNGVPSAGGMDFLVSPTGPNSNNLNSSYYQSFNIENRYINFAVNLGKLGAGAAAFSASYGSLDLFHATQKAYGVIFGIAPSDTKVHALLDPLVAAGTTRADYFAYYGGDGANGIGTKAAMVGWLLAEAALADVGTYALSNDAFLTDVALHNAPYGVDMIGHYAQASFAFNGG